MPFRLELVDRAQGAHKAPAYLKLNPNGLIPVLQHGDLVQLGRLTLRFRLELAGWASRAVDPTAPDDDNGRPGE